MTGNYENAILDFTKAIDLKPTNAAAYDGRGGGYVSEKDISEPLPTLRKLFA